MAILLPREPARFVYSATPLQNDLPADRCEQVRAGLMRFWPSLRRKHDYGCCLALWRDATAEPDGVRVEQREYWIR